MESTQDATSDGVVVSPSETFRLRSYQAEMVEESLKSNIIVAMDTGSGKTHIAVSRTAIELETCESDKLVWFLAPTVALVDQQYSVFKTHLSGYGIQILSSSDGVDHWTDQRVWDAVLANIRVVLSTHQILLDALSHGFIKMSNLALLIFDEAHHCTRNHPANLILAHFYHPQIHKNIHLPKILGLSASPVMRAKVNGKALKDIERNMNSTTKTPKIHRSELLQHVHKPQLIKIAYPQVVPYLSTLYASLKAEVDHYDIGADPYINYLLTEGSDEPNVPRKLERAYLSRNTYCYQQLRTILTKSESIGVELGACVTDWYIQQSVARFHAKLRSSREMLDLSLEEKHHLMKIFNRLPLSSNPGSGVMSLGRLSSKVEALVNILAAETGPNVTCLIFIEQRSWVAALAEILSLHPKTQGRFTMGTYVGGSLSTKRKTSIGNLIDPNNQPDTLEKLQAGQIDLVLTTSVLEEGIDVSTCDLVICFESPKNLKSFVQRRGRARRKESKFFIFLPEAEVSQRLIDWESLEEDMKRAYLKDLHTWMLEERVQPIEEEDDETRFYRVSSTGALLTFSNALQHLYHFCSVLSSGPYIDSRPQFQCEEMTGDFTAEVMLPLSISIDIRVTKSLKTWRTEAMAMKDAAFETCKKLHVNGLINDNLLPVREEVDEELAAFQRSDDIASFSEATPTLDVWSVVAKAQLDDPHVYHRVVLEFHGITSKPFHLILLTPLRMPESPDITLYWNESDTITVKSYQLPCANFTREEIETMQCITLKILGSALAHILRSPRYDLLWLLVPTDSAQDIWNHSKLLLWNARTMGSQRALKLVQEGANNTENWGLLRCSNDPVLYMPKNIQNDYSPSQLGSFVHAIRFPKRRNFLNPIPFTSHRNKAYTRVDELSIIESEVSNLPTAFSISAVLVPSVMDYYESFILADMLRTNLLAPIALESSHVPLILQAVTPSMIGPRNYQRLEFLGDCILKFIVSVQLMANDSRPEVYLTGKKGKITSNGFLARACLKAKLDQYIIRKRFTGLKWQPKYAGEVLSTPPSDAKVILSSKTLADVVESLIGVSYVVGGIPKASICMQTLLPGITWPAIQVSNENLYRMVPDAIHVNNLSSVEALIGYRFQKKMVLLEALTHASYTGPANCSYERLEFLGDAVLDYIVSKRVYAHESQLKQDKMHATRSAMVNASFLAFRMLEMTMIEELVLPMNMERVTEQRNLAQYLRLDSNNRIIMNAAIEQHNAVRTQIIDALENDCNFPWHLFALIETPKFLSDVVESVIGAIYVDSRGDIASCESFVRRLGILDCLKHVLDNDISCLHPKGRLGMIALDKTVRYVIVTEENSTAGLGQAQWAVQVEVGGKAVGGVVRGPKKLHAETIAAWEALKILEATQDVPKEIGDSGEVNEFEEREIEDENEEEEEWFDAQEELVME